MNNHILKYILKPIDSLMTSSIRLKNPGFLSCNRHVASFLMRRGTDSFKKSCQVGNPNSLHILPTSYTFSFNLKVYFFLSFFVHPAKKCDKKKGNSMIMCILKKVYWRKKKGMGWGQSCSVQNIVLSNYKLCLLFLCQVVQLW